MQVWVNSYGKNSIGTLLYKLRLLKIHLKAWYDFHFGRGSKQPSLVRAELFEVQQALSGNPFDLQLQRAETKLQFKL